MLEGDNDKVSVEDLKERINEMNETIKECIDE